MQKLCKNYAVNPKIMQKLRKKMQTCLEITPAQNFEITQELRRKYAENYAKIQSFAYVPAC